MDSQYDYQAALKTLRKLLAGARTASEQGKYAALERIIQGAEKISEKLLSSQDKAEFIDAITAKQALNREFVEGFKNIAKQQHEYIRVVGEIVS